MIVNFVKELAHPTTPNAISDVLNTNLPLINKSLSQLLDIASDVAATAFQTGSLVLGSGWQLNANTANLDKPGEGKVIYDKLPGGNDHSWKFLRIKDDKLYIPIGAPCNICDPGEYAKIYRMNLDGTGIETLAAGGSLAIVAATRTIARSAPALEDWPRCGWDAMRCS